MADSATISNLIPAENIDQGMLFETSKPDGESTTGYVTRSIALSGLGDAIASTLEYQTKLETNSKTITGAINELKRGGGGGGSSVTMSDNATGGVDLTVEGTTKTLAKQRDIETLYKITQGQLWDFVDQQESGVNIAPKGTQRQSLISVDGKSEQETTTGKNLSGIVQNIGFFRPASNASITVGGERASIIANVDKNTEYTISKNNIGDRLRVLLFYDEPSETPIPSKEVTSTSYSELTATFNTGEYNWVGIQFNATSVINRDELKVQLEKGTTDTAYEPYTGGVPSPSPAYPQPITSVEELNFKVTGRNLFNIGLFSNGGMDNGTKNETAPFRMTNATNPTSALYAIPVVGGRTYTLSIDISKSKYLGVRCGVHTLNENGEFIKDSGWLQFATEKTRSITFLENARYALFVLSFSTTSTQVSTGSTESMERLDIDYIKNNVFIMFEEGTTATPYEPYREATRTITPPFALNKIGDYADYASIETGEWVKNNEVIDFTQEVRVEKTDGNAPFTLVDAPQIQSDDNDKNSWGKCSYCLVVANTKTWSSYDFMVSYSTASYPFKPRFRNTNANNDVNQFKLLMSEANAVFIYNTTTPTTQTPIEATDLEYLKSLQNLDSDNVITITDQNGNDISYLMKYLIKLSEAI